MARFGQMVDVSAAKQGCVATFPFLIDEYSSNTLKLALKKHRFLRVLRTFSQQLHDGNNNSISYGNVSHYV
jgi:hypothetical protein